MAAQLPQILENAENGLRALAREVLTGLLEQFRELSRRIQQYDVTIHEVARQSEPARRLMQVESIGAMTATAIAAGVTRTCSRAHATTPMLRK